MVAFLPNPPFVSIDRFGITLSTPLFEAVEWESNRILRIDKMPNCGDFRGKLLDRIETSGH